MRGYSPFRQLSLATPLQLDQCGNKLYKKNFLILFIMHINFKDFFPILFFIYIYIMHIFNLLFNVPFEYT